MRVKDILNFTNGKLIGNSIANDKINSIKIDSRKVEKNDVFICLIGEKKDGHDYIKDAIFNGAKIIITSKRIDYNVPYILVKNTTIALGDIAKNYLKTINPIVIAITGSVGKTTTRLLIYHLLSCKYKCITNEKNYNNNIGVPLTIFNLKKDTDILITELGMNHFNEISYLSNMVKPDIAVITNIGSSHIGNLKSKENILKAKLEILDGMDKKILFINGDDNYLNNIEVETVFSAGTNDRCDLKAYDISGDLYVSSFKINYENKEYKLTVYLPTHLISDVLIAINVALYYKIDINDIIEHLKTFKSYDKRMDIIKDSNNNTIINDCYNSSFESLTGVLKILQNIKHEKLLIIGSIKELGIFSNEIHNSIKKYLEKITNKNIIFIGEEFENIKMNAKYFKNYEDALKYLKNQNIRNTLILIKASRSLKLENITNFFINNELPF